MNSNTIEFVMRMKDLMSSGLNKISQNSQSAFSRMAQHADQMNRRNRVLGMSFDELQKQIREVENTVRTSTIPNQIASARRELATLQRQANNHAGNLNGGQSSGNSGGIGIGGMAVGSMLGGLATQAGTALLGIVKDGIGGAISGSMEKQQAITGLTTFLGKNGANEAYKNIRKDADISPFDTPSLLAVNRALISAGLNAKDAREDSMNLANAISAVGGGNAELQRMAANMQQIKTVGKATAMDIKQFGMTGINIYEMLSRSTGKSIEQVKNMDVSYNELAKAMALARGKGGIYQGALEAQGNTMSGKWSTVKDKFGSALTDIGDAFSPVINKVLDVAIKMANSISPILTTIQPYIDSISGGLSIAIDYVTNFANGTGGWGDYLKIAHSYYLHIWSALKNVFASVWKIVSGVAEWMQKSEMVKDFLNVIYKLFGAVWDVVGWIGNKLGWLWDNVLKPILDKLEEGYRWFKKMTNQPITGAMSLDIKMPPPPKMGDLTKLPEYAVNLTRFSKNATPSGSSNAINESNKKNKENRESSRKTGETISSGGQKTINITLGKFFENINFNTLNGNESADKLESIVMECMGRVLYEGAKMV